MSDEHQPEASTEKKKRRPRGTGSIFTMTGSRNLWVGYTDATGKWIRESSGSEKKTEAQNFLRRRLEAVSVGNFLGPRVEKITVNELFDDLLKDYRRNGQFVLWPQRCWNVHLQDYFGGVKLPLENDATYSGMKASRIGSSQIEGYIEKRQSEGASQSTINRELALLRRAYSLGFDAEPQKVTRIPKFHKYIVSEKGNERRGFIEQPQYRKLAEASAGQLWLRGLLALAYTYGFRKGELLGNRETGQSPMRCKQVDLLNNTVTLYSGETKNDEGRTVALTEECRILLTELRRGKQSEDFLFTRDNGEPVRDFRGTWETLCCQLDLGRMVWVCGAKGCRGQIVEDKCEICSGQTRRQKYEGLIFHDQRRSAVRNSVRRGVPERVAMKISGHKTRSVFERYNITSEADIIDAARKIEAGARNSELTHSEVENVPSDGRQKDRKSVQSVS
jgi:integrase